eukprot:6187988-Pleurochrysis_carterae.AAC.2
MQSRRVVLTAKRMHFQNPHASVCESMLRPHRPMVCVCSTTGKSMKCARPWPSAARAHLIQHAMS